MRIMLTNHFIVNKQNCAIDVCLSQYVTIRKVHDRKPLTAILFFSSFFQNALYRHVSTSIHFRFDLCSLFIKLCETPHKSFVHWQSDKHDKFMYFNTQIVQKHCTTLASVEFVKEYFFLL